MKIYLIWEEELEQRKNSGVSIFFWKVENEDQKTFSIVNINIIKLVGDVFFFSSEKWVEIVKDDVQQVWFAIKWMKIILWKMLNKKRINFSWIRNVFE